RFQFCIAKGGRREVKKDESGGGYALCHLPDSRIVEEWEYCRSHKVGGWSASRCIP
ncbi:DUF333 domain-containing protein, partial [Neisseria gonorrhoeae]|uniref:DUF333 domain-containing protein n=1 Tax=Neisseria gonorrhoeae TaxID=485 RepID=UPI0038500111